MLYRKLPYERLDGSVRGEERFNAIGNFTDDSDTFAFLLSTRAGGMGLNLVAADTVIFTDLDFNPQMDLQAEARVFRIGQKRDVTIYRLITQDTVEEIMLKRSFKKMALSMNVIEKGGFGNMKDEPLATEDILQLVKYGLHKIIRDENTDVADDADEVLKRMDIDEILNAKKIVSFGEMTNKAIGLDTQDYEDEANEPEASKQDDDSVYMFEGKNYGTKKKGTGKKKSTVTKTAALSTDKSEQDDLSDYSEDEKEEQDDEEEEEEEDQPMVKVYSLRKRTTQQRGSASSRSGGNKYKKRSNDYDYESLNIVIPDDYSDESDGESTVADTIDLSLSQTTLLSGQTNRRINYVIGDVTKPLDNSDRVKMIINCVSDRGSWARGGLCSAIVNNLSDEPKDKYEEAGRNYDLSLGDAQMVPISSHPNIYVINVVAQSYDRSTGKHGGIELPSLQVAFNKVCYAAKEIGASVHCPRIGYGLPNFNWYGVERIIKKCLVNAGVSTYVYYYKRGGGGSNSTTIHQTQQPQRSPQPRASTRTKNLVRDDDDDYSDDEKVSSSSPISRAKSTLAVKTTTTAPSERRSSNPTSIVTQADRAVHDEDKDVFEDVKFSFYNMQEHETKQLKRLIIENGGSVTAVTSAQIIVTRDEPSSNDDLNKIVTNGQVSVHSPEWIHSQINQHDN